MNAEARAWRVKERARLKQQRLALASADRVFLTEALRGISIPLSLAVPAQNLMHGIGEQA